MNIEMLGFEISWWWLVYPIVFRVSSIPSGAGRTSLSSHPRRVRQDLYLYLGSSGCILSGFLGCIIAVYRILVQLPDFLKFFPFESPTATGSTSGRFRRCSARAGGDRDGENQAPGASAGAPRRSPPKRLDEESLWTLRSKAAPWNHVLTLGTGGCGNGISFWG